MTYKEIDKKYEWTKDKVDDNKVSVVDFDHNTEGRNFIGRILPIFPDGKYEYKSRTRFMSPQKMLVIAFCSPVGSDMSKKSFDELLHTYITKYPEEFDTP